MATQPTKAARGPFVAGVDLGGTKLLAGIADSTGRLMVRRSEPTLHGGNGRVIQQIATLVCQLMSECGVADDALSQLVIGVPGVVSPQTGLASLSPNLALPQDQPLATLVRAELNAPVAVENDVNLSAFGEAKAGVGKDLESLAFVSFGTGVGMGLVIDGKLIRGAEGRAGEIGYVPVGAEPHRDAPHSENGLYEDAVGTAGIKRRFLKPDETVADLFARAEAGDAPSQAAIAAIAADAATGIASIHALVDPAVTVIGGGIGSHPRFISYLIKSVGPLLPFPCRIEPSLFGAEAGLMGALMFAAKLSNENQN
ncbi:ROK family protein [Martelella alba]|uniref:ROK family protein n=1 Tax=Martelella alba TaxID=2590451 RepID=A0A506U2H3_9HYPH|nr:ROK family protein [Martelella alba]